jgi:hypothetical protein
MEKEYFGYTHAELEVASWDVGTGSSEGQDRRLASSSEAGNRAATYRPWAGLSSQMHGARDGHRDNP